MSQDWSTQAKDMMIAEQIIEAYANEHDADSLGLFEVVFDEGNKQFDFRLSGWVQAITLQFKLMYGEEQGAQVTRHVVTRCMTRGQTIH